MDNYSKFHAKLTQMNAPGLNLLVTMKSLSLLIVDYCSSIAPMFVQCVRVFQDLHSTVFQTPAISLPLTTEIETLEATESSY
jgi:hypothetical protein